jgi:hypothetical protein
VKQYFLLEKINRLGLTAAFLASVAFMAVWNLPGAGRAAIKAMEQEEAGNRKLWAGIPGALDSYYSESIKGRYRFIEGNGLIKSLAGLRTCNDTVRLDNGCLERLSNEFHIEETIESLTKLNQYCQEQGIPFLCVLAPSKVCRYDPGLPVGVPDQVNPGADQVVAGLREEGVFVMDLREILHEEGLSHEEMFFHTDHHWTSEGAFWGYQKLVERLNSDYGYSIDKSLTDRDNFCEKDFPEAFLGSYGKRTGKYFGGVDDISVILPDFPTNLQTEVPDRGLVREGDFSQAILDWSQIEDSWYYDDSHIPYAVYTGDDYNLIRHTNQTAGEDKTVLFLKDSFVRPVESFLSLGVRQVEAIDLRIEPRISVKDYVAENRPDMVIFMCSIWALKDYNLIDFGL